MFIKDHTDLSGRVWGADRIIANDNEGKQRPRTKMGAENKEFGLIRIEFQSIWGHPIAYVVDASFRSGGSQMTRSVRVKRHVYLWVLSIEMVQHFVFPHNLRQRWGVQKIEDRPKNRTLWHTMIWGFRAWKVEISPRTDTYRWRFLKLNWNHDKALPLIPKQHSRRCNKIPWSTRSKAAERSSSNKATDLLSIALKISSWTLFPCSGDSYKPIDRFYPRY